MTAVSGRPLQFSPVEENNVDSSRTRVCAHHRGRKSACGKRLQQWPCPSPASRVADLVQCWALYVLGVTGADGGEPGSLM